ncbi:nucleophile aminohydrolase [Dipodascopsis uninucleata]
MDIVLGITTKDAVLIATSMAAVRGVSILKTDDDKTRIVAPHTLIAFTGEAGDTVQFAEYAQANIQLHGMRNEVELSTSAISSFIRSELANSLRSRKPYQVNLLVAGYDVTESMPKLYYVDYLAAKAEVPYTAHGYAAFYVSSLLDRWHRRDISMEEGIKIMNMCIAELRTRLPIDFKGIQVKAVDKDGIRTLDL